MNKFETVIKEQIMAYNQQLALAQAAHRQDNVSMIRAQIAAYRLGLETCLNKNYVSTFFDYVNGYYGG